MAGPERRFRRLSPNAMTPTPPDSQDPKKEDFQFPSLHAGEPAPVTPVAEPPTQTPPSAQAPAETPAKKTPLNIDKAQVIQQVRELFFRHKFAGIVTMAVVLVGVMWGISRIQKSGGNDDKPATQPGGAVDEVPVNVIEAHLGRFQDTINAVGTLKGEAEVELRFEVDGKIEDFDVTEGAKVRRGQVIAKLSDKDSRLKVERARIELQQKEQLFNLGAISKVQLDEARLNLDIAQTESDKTRLVATRDGILGDKAAEIGEFVTPQRKIATLVAIKNVVVKVGIIEKQVDKVYPGQKILVTVDAYPGNVFEGTIQSISPIITGESKTFEITAKIPNSDSLLLPGMFARSRIITFEADDAISIPNDALAKTPGGFQVFVVNKDNVAEMRDVEVGYVATDSTQIRSGLNPGDIIIVQRPPELKAGSKVKVIEVQKAEGG